MSPLPDLVRSKGRLCAPGNVSPDTFFVRHFKVGGVLDDMSAHIDETRGRIGVKIEDSTRFSVMSPPMPRRLAARSSAVPAAGRFCIRAGRGEPLLLLHGVTGSARMWKHVVPLLAPHHDVIAPTALGHRGGKRAERRPVRVTDVVDDVERCIDEYGFDRVHLAGNSLGGWVALELARRGRGLSGSPSYATRRCAKMRSTARG
jgi:pimeloyl-ACP methyl ester carboxylesterase